MGKVIADQSISLDGFSAGPNVRRGKPLGDGGDRLHAWYEQGGDQVRDELFEACGALVMGRLMFDVGVEPWGEDPPFHMPVFVVTHHARDPLVKEGGTTYFFITDGVEAALAQAKSTSGDEDVGIQGGANVLRQLLNAGLVDELRIHLVHVLLGEGTRLFDATNAKHAGLESTRTTQTPGATHLTFRTLRKESD